MTLRRILNLVLAICLAFSLAAGSVVTPAAAVEAAAMADMSAMPADMDCCPSEHGQKNKHCQDCPQMATCAMKTAQIGPSQASAMVVRHAVRTSHALMDDALTDGIVRPPPDHPPRA